jgi:hypothetical protein
MKFLLIILVSINLFADIKMPQELFGTYFNTTFGPETCTSLKEDQDLWKVNQYGISYGTWYVCIPTKVVLSKYNKFSINMDCGVDAEDENTTKDTMIFKKQAIYINSKIIAKRCK